MGEREASTVALPTETLSEGIVVKEHMVEEVLARLAHGESVLAVALATYSTSSLGSGRSLPCHSVAAELVRASAWSGPSLRPPYHRSHQFPHYFPDSAVKYASAP